MFAVKQVTTRLLQFQSLLRPSFHFAQNSSLATSMNPDVERLHEFWFRRGLDEWFAPNNDLDRMCEQEFGPLMKKARAHELDDWTSEPKSTLALIVLLDQFPRNVHRGTAEAFSSDSKAMEIATIAVAKDWDKQVEWNEALAFYLPLMHSETLISNVACINLVENLISRLLVGSEGRTKLEESIGIVYQHRDTILRFGRYPGRNKALGRTSTKEEEELLIENPHRYVPAKPDAGK